MPATWAGRLVGVAEVVGVAGPSRMESPAAAGAAAAAARGGRQHKEASAAAAAAAARKGVRGRRPGSQSNGQAGSVGEEEGVGPVGL